MSKLRPNKPGPGWFEVSKAVFNYNRIKLHVLGLAKVDGVFIDLYRADRRGVERAIKAAGGNKRRGLMAYVRTHYGKKND